jgi:hypothetical protein
MSRRHRRIRTAFIASFCALAVGDVVGNLHVLPDFPPISGPVNVAIDAFGIFSIVSTVVFLVLLLREERDSRK